MQIPFDNTYARLPERFYARQEPARVPAPMLIRLNRELAAQLTIDADWLHSADGVATLAGNEIPEGAEPIAQADAGHQFGGFAPQLGDGRALLLGEVVDTDGARRDLQLKGSGRTPFSRGGDGKSALRLHPERVVVPDHDWMQRSQRGIHPHHFQVAIVLGLRSRPVTDRQQFGTDVLMDGPEGHTQLGRDLSKTGTTRSRQNHPLPSKGNPLFFPDPDPWSSSSGLLLGSPLPRVRTLGVRCLPSGVFVDRFAVILVPFLRSSAFNLHGCSTRGQHLRFPLEAGQPVRVGRERLGQDFHEPSEPRSRQRAPDRHRVKKFQSVSSPTIIRPADS